MNPMTFAGDLGVLTGDRGQEEALDGYPAGWLAVENASYKWMMPGGTTILGNFHV